MLTKERLKEVLHYNPETGLFTWIVRTAMRTKAGEIAGRKDRYGYVFIQIDRKKYPAHRIAWLYVNGVFPNEEIDHINGMRDDNRISNLREADRRLNCENRRKSQSNNKLGILGVCKLGSGKYQAQIVVGGEKKYLKCWDTPELAHQAYLTAKRKLHLYCTI